MTGCEASTTVTVSEKKDLPSVPSLPNIELTKFGVMEVQRDQEFAAIKNANGAAADTPEYSCNMLYELHKSWVVKAGGKIEEGEVPMFEIDPLVSLNGEGLEERVAGKTFKTPYMLSPI